MAKRPSAKQIAARRAFAMKYGGKRSRRKASTTGTPKMARFARTRSYARSARRGVSRSRSFGGSNKALIDGALAGAALPFANKFVPGGFGTPAALIGVGMFRRNDALTTLGVMQATAGLVGSSGVAGVTGAGSGGWL